MPKRNGEKRGREIVYARSLGLCERCRDRLATEWQHRKNRSQGGTWAASNGLHLCSPCHRWVTGHPTTAYAMGWSVRSTDDPRAVPALLFRGLVYLTDDGRMTDTPEEAAA